MSTSTATIDDVLYNATVVRKQLVRRARWFGRESTNGNGVNVTMGMYIQQQSPVQYYQPIQQPVQQSPAQVGQYGPPRPYQCVDPAAAGALIGNVIGLGLSAFLGVAAIGLQAAAYCPPGGSVGQYPGHVGQYPGQVGQYPTQMRW